MVQKLVVIHEAACMGSAVLLCTLAGRRQHNCRAAKPNWNVIINNYSLGDRRWCKVMLHVHFRIMTQENTTTVIAVLIVASGWT